MRERINFFYSSEIRAIFSELFRKSWEISRKR
nr:MAG TPA: hypothetical protein [Caudoviricetes sp.]